MKYLLLILSLTLMTSISIRVEANECRAIFDAGSSGTRLYLYEEQNSKWIEHEGPKIGALADPVRQIRGKTWKDIINLSKDVLATLDNIKIDGPLDAQRKPQWFGFDWSTRCTLYSVSIYATAGMRIAEQEDSLHSQLLWEALHALLEQKLGKNVQINTKTLTGFEEGLFAWLSIHTKQKHSANFGIMEIGGASAQVAFPCSDCDEAQPVLIDGVPQKMFSYSFLGLGSDELVTTIGITPACTFGIGKNNRDWNEKMCSDTIQFTTPQGIRDPYNYGPNGRGLVKIIPSQIKNIHQWYGLGALAYLSADDLENCCISGNGNSCFQPDISCFRTVYLRKYLQEFGINELEMLRKPHDSWTLGAVVCEQTNCLSPHQLRTCHWMKDQCLMD